MAINNIEYCISQFGNPCVIKTKKAQLSSPLSHEVQLRIMATGLSMADVLIRRGVYPDVKRPNVVMGYEAIAEIVALGSNVSRTHPNLQLGNQVALMTITGNNTHFRNISANDVVLLPENISNENVPKAASLMLNYVTAYQMLYRHKLVINDTTARKKILIHSAAGGVGMALIQLLQLLDVDIYGTASKEKHENLRRYGVIPIDYRTDDIRKICEQAGRMDFVFDGIGGTNLDISTRCLKKKGQLVVFGMTVLGSSHKSPRLNFIRFLLTSIKYLLKSKLSTRFLFYSITDMRTQHPDWFVADFYKVFELFLDGTIKPELAPLLPMSSIVNAHKKLEAGELKGKQILIPDPLFNQ